MLFPAHLGRHICAPQKNYSAAPSNYGGTQYATLGAGLTGAADGKVGTLSCWIRQNANNDTNLQHFLSNATAVGGTTIRFNLLRPGSGTLYRIIAASATGVNVLTMNTNSSYSSTVWNHILASWDLQAGTRQLYVNDVSDLAAGSSSSNTAIDYTVADWGFGARCDGGVICFARISEFWFDTTRFTDLSVESNRRKFIVNDNPGTVPSGTIYKRPAFLGEKGELPFGSSPIIYMPRGDSTDNKGSGGNFTVRSGTVGKLENPIVRQGA